ncbi:DynA interaction protein YwpG [Bacillus subtilis]|uniref:DynA interaction protein YwpG n=1 Tax=Bacillus subtilis TaxID=1423 RepID=UPI002DC03186|nr:DynA interaction protein YwpG [Bacillus subtilis]MEC1581337.1 DynA interaction protein YwpG [Bacillus subtilis]
MNQFRLKEIYIDGVPSESHLIQKEVTYMLSRKEVFEVHLNKKGKISFLYETQDGMEQYKIKLSMPEKKLSFQWFAWDGSSYVRMNTQNWLTKQIFFRFLKSTYFFNGKKQKMFLAEGKMKTKDKNRG